MMDSGAGSLIKPRKKWRFILPISNLLLAVCLLAVGHYQQRSISPQSTETTSGGEWIPAQEVHLAPGTQVAYAINFPALIAASPLKGAGRPVVIGGFLCVLLILWYIVGRILDSGAPRPGHKSTALTAVSVVGVLAAVVGIWFAWQAIGTHYLIPPLGGLLWSLALGAYCITLLRNVASARRMTAS
jgi:hypothetical protein